MLPFARPTIEQIDRDAVNDVLTSGWLATGPRAAELESAMADYLGGEARVCLLNSGTSALELAVVAAGLGTGDEVIVPAMSFVASAHAVLRAGATPVLVDVDPASRNLTADDVKAALTPRTRALMPVHFAGQPVDMEPIESVASAHGLRMIEDAAHAIGARYRGRPIGAAGDLVCFSFHPNKNMTTIEGGALVCFDAESARHIERLRFHGIERDADGRMDVAQWGGKMNLPDVNAALGLTQLARLEQFNQKRRQLAAHYHDRLTRHPQLSLPPDADGHSWHIFTVCVNFAHWGVSRAEFQRRMRALGIATGVHYPAIHTFDCYRRRGYRPDSCPNAYRIGEQTLTLPLFPGMQEADVDWVCESLCEVLEGLDSEA